MIFMDFMKKYEQWLQYNHIDEETKQELLSLKGNDAEIQDRFYQDLVFGTAGLRGKLGAGTNRMNKYIIARATHAFAQVIKSYGDDYMKRGVAIAHDCRIKSDEFAETAALILAANGIKAYLYDSLRSTPQLSFTVRHLHCAGGLNITASHNPKEYNGYKVYWEEGSQIKDNIADKILSEIEKIDDFGKIPNISMEDAKSGGLLEIIGEPIDTIYLDKVKELSLRDRELDKNVCIVYTPLNGAGSVPVQRVLKERGFTNVHVVKEQEQPDGTFPTVTYPNPEDIAAFEYSLKLAEKVNADILIATDPDSDRLAVMVKKDGTYKDLTGNQTGALLIEYLFSSMKEKGILPDNGLMVKTIVTGEMGATIAKSYGVEVVNVLTGFKNIAAITNQYDETHEKNVLFGYEESIGYTAGTFVRDKDAVSAAMLLAEAAAYYKAQGKTLFDVLFELFEKHGFFWENTKSFVSEGMEGQARIARIMKEYRKNYPIEIETMKLHTVIDYSTSLSTELPTGKTDMVNVEKTNAVKFIFEDGSWYALRPSGTEPKLKIYFSAQGNAIDDVFYKLKRMEEKVLSVFQSIE